MSTPEHGDRIRVSYEAVYEVGPTQGIQPGCYRVRTDEGRVLYVPPEAVMEVLAVPVYANTKTTEYRNGDVVTDADNLKGLWVYGDYGDRRWWQPGMGTRRRGDLPKRLRLLVRDNQVVV